MAVCNVRTHPACFPALLLPRMRRGTPGDAQMRSSKYEAARGAIAEGMQTLVAGHGLALAAVSVAGASAVDYSDFDVWDFKRDSGGHWTWAIHSVDGEPMAGSRRSFDTIDQCVDDAKRCGYSGAFMAPDAG